MKPLDPELQAALDAIGARPGEEARRQVLADLLLERGDPRGEFLLLQFLIAANQFSGAMRQRAEDLWRTHKREWMRGVDQVLTDVTLERGFPVEASLQPGTTVAKFEAMMHSPMVRTLRHLRARHAEGPVLVEAAASPLLLELRGLEVVQQEALTQVLERGVPGRLRFLRVTVPLKDADVDGLLSAPAASALEELVISTEQRARVRQPETLTSAVTRLSTHPTLRSLVVASAFGDRRLCQEMLLLWPRVRFTKLSGPGCFELVREAEGTHLLLQNLSVGEMIELRGALPPGVVKVRLMPNRRPQSRDRDSLLTAFQQFDPRVLP